jgi:hypothetical protein
VSLPSSVGIGDLLRAFTLIKPADAVERQEIATLLGFTHAGPATIAAQVSEERPEPDGVSAHSDTSQEPPETEPQPPLHGQTDVREVGAGPSEVPYLTPLETAVPVRPNWLDGIQPLAQEKRGADSTVRHLPLFHANLARSVLLDTVRTVIDGNELDIEHVIQTLARAGGVSRLPRIMQRSLVRGVQLLVDYGEGMDPFARDADDLALRIELLFGDERVQRLAFQGSPALGVGTGPVWTWGPYVPPSRGVPVVGLTDLGIGGRLATPHIDFWSDLAGLLARRGSQVVLFVPYLRSRWPKGIPASVRMIVWDRPRWRSRK